MKLTTIATMFALIAVAACGGAVAPRVDDSGPVVEVDAGREASRENCDYSILQCSDEDFDACRDALSEQEDCTGYIPDACKPCIRL